VRLSSDKKSVSKGLGTELILLVAERTRPVVVVFFVFLLMLLSLLLVILVTALLITFKASALWADAFYKSKCPSVCPSVCLCVCLFTFEVPFNGLFAPTSRSRMSNISRDSESLGKSNGKKWTNI
jgi:hypothetical protein